MMRDLLEFDDAGASDDEPAKKVTVGDIRAWHDEFERLRSSLRAIRNHWNEFGPEYGFDETLEQACATIDINKGKGSIWAGLPRA